VIDMPGIKDVAKKAGVGIATVSRVINNSGYVKKETREKVEKVIAEMRFHPNEIARSMLKQKNGIVAFILPNTFHRFFGELVHAIEQELFKYGYKLLVCNSSEQTEKELTYLEMLRNNRVDAIIFLTNNDIESHLDKSLPIISFDRRFDGVPYIASDNYAGGVMAAKYLIEQGCQHLVFVGDDAQGETTKVHTEVSKRRLGFMDYANEHGINEVVNIEYPLGDYVAIPHDVHDQINNIKDVDGIFCISDAVATEVILEIEKNGKKVPEDIKVIGFDGGRSFANLGKHLTSIGQNPDAIAKAIGEMIHSYYESEVVHDKIVPVYFHKGDTA
jgi:DNA-binding LacI/PurR family transcriptional regulator